MRQIWWDYGFLGGSKGRGVFRGGGRGRAAGGHAPPQDQKGGAKVSFAPPPKISKLVKFFFKLSQKIFFAPSAQDFFLYIEAYFFQNMVLNVLNMTKNMGIC